MAVIWLQGMTRKMVARIRVESYTRLLFPSPCHRVPAHSRQDGSLSAGAFVNHAVSAED